MNENEKYLNLNDHEEVALVLKDIQKHGMMDVSNKTSEQLGKGTRTCLRYILAVLSGDGELSDMISKYTNEYLSDEN